MIKAKAIYPELTKARESATITCVLAETQKKAEEWESFILEKREGFRYTLLEAVVLGEMQTG